MTIQRGDAVLVQFPFTSGAGSKLRPALVIQSDRNNARLSNVIVAAITTTTRRSGEPTQLAIDISTLEGRQSGLLRNSVIACENIATVDKGLMVKKIGQLRASSMAEVNSCLKAALGF